MLIFIFMKCAEEPQESLWNLDPNYQVKPNPTITNVEPSSAYAGITEVTIYGTNFDPSDNYTHTRVYFGGMKAEVISCTTEEIKCITPVIAGDSLIIKVTVDGAMLFAESEPYKVVFAQKDYGGITGAYDAYGIAVDLEENLYVSLGEGKILKVSPEEEPIDTLTSDEGVDGFYKSMKMGPNKTLYAARTIFIYQFPEGVSGTRVKMSKSVNDFDFDENINIFYATKFEVYVAGQDLIDRKVADYPEIILSTIRVYNGYIYVAGYYNGSDTSVVQKGIWRNQITNTAGDLGPNELVFDWQAYYGKGTIGIPQILAITFAEDGDLYVGADSTIISDAITVIHPDGNGNYLPENAEPLFSSVLMPPATNLTWGTGQYLYVNRRSLSKDFKRIIRVTMGKNSAPYFGRR
jgi:hypothetical protein